ncbi:uncharacterized protein LOC114033019 isoform X1 [Vombatus ursinus]|uniref:uncharacterized protein LOC114033018 isoform X2 n=1 Tax=Vombatus ursinus TaxID=29139 RepID=UPI000FFD6AED|nr:uncharacterized protein LOC114033018 isoform X2 [Vombatus ursinus]XP_027704266.1 uncharacterized protein LOC114033019 isoform X1 [Vombatus ursinus]
MGSHPPEEERGPGAGVNVFQATQQIRSAGPAPGYSEDEVAETVLVPYLLPHSTQRASVVLPVLPGLRVPDRGGRLCCVPHMPTGRGAQSGMWFWTGTGYCVPCLQARHLFDKPGTKPLHTPHWLFPSVEGRGPGGDHNQRCSVWWLFSRVLLPQKAHNVCVLALF